MPSDSNDGGKRTALSEEKLAHIIDKLVRKIAAHPELSGEEKKWSSLRAEPPVILMINVFIEEVYVVKVPPPLTTPRWFAPAGFVCLVAFGIFLVVLINREMSGVPVPTTARMLVVFLMAIVLALGFAFIGGDAAAKGHIPIPFAKENPIKFSLRGGMAVFFIVLIVGYLMYGKGPEATAAGATQSDKVAPPSSPQVAAIRPNTAAGTAQSDKVKLPSSFQVMAGAVRRGLIDRPPQQRVLDVAEGLPRISELLIKYGDRPMDFADASLVWAAEQTGAREILTTDQDFEIYRILA